MENKFIDVIKAPIITEKTADLAEANKIVFEVSLDSNKTQIKQAVESIFDVEVKKVNTIVTTPKKKRVGRYEGKTKKIKKAIVTLKEGSSIELN